MANASNIKNLYGFISGTTVLEIKDATTIAPFLYRFIGKYIKPNAKIFDIETNPYNNGNTWTFRDSNLNNYQIGVESGDVWISSGNAYIYYTNAEINEGMYVDVVTEGGGWKKADMWHLRTYNIDQNLAYENQFEKVLDNGQILYTPSNKYRLSEGRIICPEFSI
jgi:hypothetical protein